jgi:hypothetical protein
MTIYTGLGAWMSNQDRGDLMTVPGSGSAQSTSEPMIGKANPV